MEPTYVRRFPLTIPYTLYRKRGNRYKRAQFRRLYEEILLGRKETPYEGKVIRAARQQDTFYFYLYHFNIATIKVIGGHFQPVINFHNVDYNRFRLFLRNIGINATGRKNITNVVMPNGNFFRFDHLEVGRLLHPPIPFTIDTTTPTTYAEIIMQRWHNLPRETQEQGLSDLRTATDRLLAGINPARPRRYFDPANFRQQQVYNITAPLTDQQIYTLGSTT